MHLGCYGNLKFPLTYNGKSDWDLVLSHCRYFDKSFTEMFVELSSLLMHFGCYDNLKDKATLNYSASAMEDLLK